MRNKFPANNNANPLGGNAKKNKLARQIKELLARDVDKAIAAIRSALGQNRNYTIKLQAAELILAYVYGKPSQQVDVDLSPDAAAIFLNGMKFANAIDVTQEKEKDPALALPDPSDDNAEV